MGWLVGFGLNGSLRQYFSLYRADLREREKEDGPIPERGRKEREMIDERQKYPNNPHPHLLQAQ